MYIKLARHWEIGWALVAAVHKDRQELCCASCWGYHGNFPDCDTVNASLAPAAIAFGPAWRVFVWVMRPSLIVRGPLRWKNRRPILRPCISGAKWTTRRSARREAWDKPKPAYAARNARARAAWREFIHGPRWINIQIGSKSLGRDANWINSPPCSLRAESASQNNWQDIVKYSQISHFTPTGQVHGSEPRTVTAVKWTEDSSQTRRLSEWGNPFFIQWNL